MSTSLTLVSFDLCPYVQRAAIVLAEKGVPFERRTIDLAAKPDWFRALSPLGKVPLLLVGDEVLFESAAIVEYLEETHGPAMHPADPLLRARHRAWMEVGASLLDDLWVLETTKDPTVFEARHTQMRSKFIRLEAQVTDGPLFAGTRMSIVDAVFAPVFRYFDVFDTITDLGILTDLPKVARWRAALAARPSVQNAVSPTYPEQLRAFVQSQAGVLVTGAH